MPYRSKRQERYFNANRAQMERQGINVDEWNAASKGMALPETASTKPKKPRFWNSVKKGYSPG